MPNNADLSFMDALASATGESTKVLAKVLGTFYKALLLEGIPKECASDVVLVLMEKFTLGGSPNEGSSSS